MADQAPADVQLLINDGKWKEASREIFFEAKLASKFEQSIALGQAKAGFLADALDTIAGFHLANQPSALLKLVAETPSITLEKKFELVRLALISTRKITGPNADYLKSGDLARVALFYSRNGAESESRAVFEEALSDAATGINVDGSGGYRAVTEAMVQESVGSPEWMIPLVLQHLQHVEKSANSAFAYRDLAQAAVRLNQNALALELVEFGVSSAQSISQDYMRNLALKSLAIVATKAGYTNKTLESAPYELAIQEAKSGNPQMAHSIVSGLSANLYVDHALDGYMRVFKDAVAREDLNTALYFAEHPVRQVSWVETNVWRQVAELQARNGSQKDAGNSYRRAVLAISNNPESVRYLEEVQAAVALGTSMRLNGFESESRRATLDALNMIDLIPERRVVDRVKASTLLSEALWLDGVAIEAKQQILYAYRTANGYDDKAGGEKARLLSGIGQTTSTFISKVDGQRVESKGSMKAK